MKRSLTIFAVILLGGLSTGAKSNGCATEYTPGDGSAGTWTTGPVPVAKGSAQPMTCAWIDGDNCWKPLAARAAQCAPPAGASGKGKFSTDRSSCTFPGGARLDFDAPIPAPAPSETLVPIVQWRLSDAVGAPCATGKILGVGRTLLDVQGQTFLFESPSLTALHVTCEDGSQYDDDLPETCPQVLGDFLQHRLPGTLLQCDGATQECTLSLWGGVGGEEAIAVCAP